MRLKVWKTKLKELKRASSNKEELGMEYWFKKIIKSKEWKINLNKIDKNIKMISKNK